MYEKYLKDVNEGKLSLEEAKEIFKTEFEKLEQAHTLYKEEHKKEMELKNAKEVLVRELLSTLAEYYDLIKKDNPFASVKVSDAMGILDSLTKVNAKSSFTLWDW